MKRQYRSIFLVLALALGFVSANAAIKGDVNGDGEVTISDVNAVIDIILN